MTLSTNSSFQGVGAQFNYRGVLEGQPISLRSNVLEGKSHLAQGITIEGDLNEQEIQDIQQVINQTRGLVADLSSGNVNGVVARTQQLSASGSLASIGINIQHSESLNVEQVSRSSANNTGQSVSGPVTGPPSKVTQTANTDVQNSNVPSSAGMSLKDLLRSLFTNLGLLPAQPSPAQQSSGQEGNQDRLGRFIEKVGQKFDRGVQGLKNFIDRAKETINNLAGKIAGTAVKFQHRVEHQAAKIADAFGKLQDLAKQGITSGKTVDRLNEQISKRSERLANTVAAYKEKLGDKIDNLQNYVDASNARISKKAQNLENFAGRIQDKITQHLDGETRPDAENLFAKFNQITGKGGFTDTLSPLYGQAVRQPDGNSGNSDNSGPEAVTTGGQPTDQSPQPAQEVG